MAGDPSHPAAAGPAALTASLAAAGPGGLVRRRAEEAQRLARSALEVVPWCEGTADGSVKAALGALRQRVERVYVHLDLDVLDPHIGSGVVDPPRAGQAVRRTAGRAALARVRA